MRNESWSYLLHHRKIICHHLPILHQRLQLSLSGIRMVLSNTFFMKNGEYLPIDSTEMIELDLNFFSFFYQRQSLTLIK